MREVLRLFNTNKPKLGKLKNMTFFPFFLSLLRKLFFFFWETETWDSSKNHIHQWKFCAFVFLVSGFWNLSLDWLWSLQTALLLRHQQKPNFSYLSTAAAAAYHLSKRNRRNRRRSSTPPSFLDSGYFVCGSLLLTWSLGFAALGRSLSYSYSSAW